MPASGSKQAARAQPKGSLRLLCARITKNKCLTVQNKGRTSPGHLPRRNLGVFLLGRRVVSTSAQEMIPFFCPEPPLTTFRAGLGAFPCPTGGRTPENTFVQRKKRLPRMRKTLKCGRIYKPSSVLQTGARRHPKKLLSFICCSLPPSNGRATLDCWYTWPCRLQ